VRRQRVDLGELAREILGDLQRADPERVVAIDVAPSLEADADPRLVRIGLENLLGNAWKFTRGTGGARIGVGVEGEAFVVEDNGPGFEAASARRLFQPFQRYALASEFEGTGIGLAIVNRVVRHHGGRIWAESTPGNGATFFFTLRRSEVSQ